MTVEVLGGRELRDRLDRLKLAPEQGLRRWADDTVKAARPRIRVKSGKTRASLRVQSVTGTRAVVAIRYIQRFIERDTKEHVIRARRRAALRFQDGPRTIFAPRALRRARRGTPALLPAGQSALAASPFKDAFTKAWNVR